MLGSGIFVLPGIAAAQTGSSIWLAYLLAAICILPAALSKSELATAMPSSGGTYLYIERTFGPIFGTIAGLTERYVTLEISDDVNIRVLKTHVSQPVKEGSK